MFGFYFLSLETTQWKIEMQSKLLLALKFILIDCYQSDILKCQQWQCWIAQIDTNWNLKKFATLHQ